MSHIINNDVIGIIGGMGPLASAEFLKTIYECSLRGVEQETPAVVVYSDPRVPDRTESLLNGECEILLDSLVDVLNRLRELGASRIVICCVTLHYLLSRLYDDQRRDIISLLDVIFDGVLRTRDRHLLVCTNGTRKLGLFQMHPQWQLAQDQLVLPDEMDQQLIHHKIILGIKRNNPLADLLGSLDALLAKYQVNSFIAGCTELHLLAKLALLSGKGRRSYGCIDPLAIIAKDFAKQSAYQARELSTTN